MRHPVLLACGLGAALALPALAEAGHRHTPSCGHSRYGYASDAPRAARGRAPVVVVPHGYAAPRSYRRYVAPRRLVVPVPVYSARVYARVYAPRFAPAYVPRYVPYYAPRPSLSLQLYGGHGSLHGNVGLYFGW